MRRKLLAWVLPALLVAMTACSDDDSGGKSDSGQQGQQDSGQQGQQDGGQQQQDSGGGGASCTIDVTTEETPGGMTKKTVGTATVTCDKEATLELKVCLQWESGASFEDVICQTSAESNVKTLEVRAEAGCGLTAKKYRTEATLTVDGAAEAPETSQEITACGP